MVLVIKTIFILFMGLIAAAETARPFTQGPFPPQVPEKNILIYVEGIPGGGKTTLLNILSTAMKDVEIIEEPISDFQNVNNLGNILNLVFKDPERWFLAMQVYAGLRRLNLIEKVGKKGGKIKLIERSIYSEYCFGKTRFDLGVVSPMEWFIYETFFTFLIEKSNIIPSGIIFLKLPSTLALERIKKRGRKEDNKIDSGLLNAWSKNHEDFFLHKTVLPVEVVPHLKGVPLFVLDATKDFENDLKIQKSYVKKIKLFIETLKQSAQK